MPIYQINVWVCEICKKLVTTTEEILPYSDPVAQPPDEIEWKYVGEYPNEKLACPECLKKVKNEVLVYP